MGSQRTLQCEPIVLAPRLRVEYDTTTTSFGKNADGTPATAITKYEVLTTPLDDDGGSTTYIRTIGKPTGWGVFLGAYYTEGGENKDFEQGKSYRIQYRYWNNGDPSWASKLTDPITVKILCPNALTSNPNPGFFGTVLAKIGGGLFGNLLQQITPTAYGSEEDDQSDSENYIYGHQFVSDTGEEDGEETPEESAPVLALIKEFEDITLANRETVVLDMADYFSGADLEYEVMVTTTHQRKGTTKTGPINTVARNKISGSWNESELTLTGGRAVSQELTVTITASNADEDPVSDEFTFTLDNG